MDDSQKRKSRLEIGHVLFIEIAGYSKLTTEEELEALPELNRIVRDTDQRTRQTAGPSGIGGLLVTPAPKAFGAVLLSTGLQRTGGSERIEPCRYS